MKVKIDSVDARLGTLDRMANRWKGGSTVILGLGAIVGFLLAHLFQWFNRRS